MPNSGLFITGTDTDVGKTYVTSFIAQDLTNRKLNTGVYKPLCSGAELTNGEPVWNDVEMLWEASGKKHDRKRICPQCFLEPAAPPVAAKMENKEINHALIYEGVNWWKSNSDILLVEGIGGFLCPMTEEEIIADFALRIQLPLIIVSRMSLGTINHTLLTLEAVKSRGLKIAGIIMNQSTAGDDDITTNSNPEEIQKRTDVPVLGIVPFGSSQILTLSNRTPVEIDWLSLAQ